jgi:hypothetical protein
MEPVPAGTYFEATRLVNDETEVRTRAYEELANGDALGLRRERELMYRARRRYADFEQWLANQVDLDRSRKARFDAQPKEVRFQFESRAEREDGGLAFDQVYRVDLLRRA